MKLKDTITGISFDNNGNLILSGKFIVKELRGEKNEQSKHIPNGELGQNERDSVQT